MLYKLSIVGTVAAVCAIGALYSQAPSSARTNFLQLNSEVETEFIKFIAKYGKSYTSKEELPKRFEIFERSYNLVKEHNAQEGVQFTLAINHLADLEVS